MIWYLFKYIILVLKHRLINSEGGLQIMIHRLKIINETFYTKTSDKYTK